MSTLIKLSDGVASCVEDGFVFLDDDEAVEAGLGVIVSLDRFLSQGASLLDEGRPLGVLLQPHQTLDALAYDLPRLQVIALAFPKFRDGRAYTTAALLRERFAFKGEIRAVGEVLREQAFQMVRCGFDAFKPADGATPEQWAKAAFVFHHVYQAAADGRPAAFAERRS